MERTAPFIELVGDWPPTEPGYTWMPVQCGRLFDLSNAAFRYYALLLSIAQGRTPVPPLPEGAGDIVGLSWRASRRALSELVGKGLVRLAPCGPGSPITGLLLDLPQ